MKHYLMDLVVLVSLLLIIGLVAWHNKYYDTCQAAQPPAQVTESAALPPENSTPPVTSEQAGQPVDQPAELPANTEAQAPPEPPENAPGWSNPLLKPEDADGVTQATPEEPAPTAPENAEPIAPAATQPPAPVEQQPTPTGGQPE